jgi:hypothetical protein
MAFSPRRWRGLLSAIKAQTLDLTAFRQATQMKYAMALAAQIVMAGLARP